MGSFAVHAFKAIKINILHLCFGHKSECTFKDLKREIAPFIFNTTNKNHLMFITDWPIV